MPEPTRLQILNLLRTGEHNVGELADACQFSYANVSRYLSMLTRLGLVERESRGNTVYYAIADDSVYALCDLVCSNIARHVTKSLSEKKAFAKYKNAR